VSKSLSAQRNQTYRQSPEYKSRKNAFLESNAKATMLIKAYELLGVQSRWAYGTYTRLYLKIQDRYVEFSQAEIETCRTSDNDYWFAGDTNEYPRDNQYYPLPTKRKFVTAYMGSGEIVHIIPQEAWNANRAASHSLCGTSGHRGGIVSNWVRSIGTNYCKRCKTIYDNLK